MIHIQSEVINHFNESSFSALAFPKTGLEFVMNIILMQKYILLF